jgi:hypothetical protein
MNTTTPGFTAEASLYNTRTHYRTHTRTLRLSAPRTGTIRLSEIDVPGEVIEIEDDAPFFPPPWGGHTGPGPSGGSGGDPDGGGPGGGGADSQGEDTKPPPQKCHQAKDRIEIQGVQWRKQCPEEQIYSCCKKKADNCSEQCGSSGSSASIQCKNECTASWKVCKDERNPRGPEVCSLP